MHIAEFGKIVGFMGDILQQQHAPVMRRAPLTLQVNGESLTAQDPANSNQQDIYKRKARLFALTRNEMVLAKSTVPVQPVMEVFQTTATRIITLTPDYGFMLNAKVTEPVNDIKPKAIVIDLVDRSQAEEQENNIRYLHKYRPGRTA